MFMLMTETRRLNTSLLKSAVCIEIIKKDKLSSSVTVRVRTEPSKTSNVLEFVFSVQVPSIVLEFNSMFSNVLETKCLENAIVLAVYWREELNKFAHPTTSGKKRRDPNSCRTNARQPSASCDARLSGAEAETANGCIRHKFSFGRVQLHGNSAPDDMCFRLAFSPVTVICENRQTTTRLHE